MALLFLLNNMIRNSLINNSIEYNKEQYNKSITLFEKLFEPILNLEPNDKLGIENIKPYFNEKEYKMINGSRIDFTIYLDKYTVYQSLSRWYYTQKRAIIFSKIDILFEEYFLLLNKLKILDEKSIIKYTEINKKYQELNKKLIEKLVILKSTYNDEEINKKIDSYCEKLEVKFNNSLEVILEHNKIHEIE
jgi:hypothetical protein